GDGFPMGLPSPQAPGAPSARRSTYRRGKARSWPNHPSAVAVWKGGFILSIAGSAIEKQVQLPPSGTSLATRPAAHYGDFRKARVRRDCDEGATLRVALRRTRSNGRVY